MADRPELLSDETMTKVVEMYTKGEKVRTIEESCGITRSQVYWVLRQRGVAATRLKVKSRDEQGDQEQTISDLFRLIEAQDSRIRELEAELDAIRHT